MSKTFGKNSAMEMVSMYFKQFVGWVTDLPNKYWGDIFIRTEINIVLLQMFFAVTLSVIVAASFNYLYRDILQTLLNGITETIQSHGAISGDDIFQSIQLVRAKNFFSFLVLALSVGALFSYIIAKVTLTPVRRTLRTQKRFISDVAHELRTPLAIIKTNCEVALLDETLDPEIKAVFESNIEELNRTSSIINNVLSFNTLVNPEHIIFGILNLQTIVERSIKRLGDLAESKRINIVLESPAIMTVWGNEAALEQIATNLIKNAISYSPEGKDIHVSIERRFDNELEFTVADNGIGIAAEQQRYIFEPFYRVEPSRNRNSGSTGLGLAIVSELVKLHKAKILVKSRLGKGTRMTVLFPYAVN